MRTHLVLVTFAFTASATPALAVEQYFFTDPFGVAKDAPSSREAFSREQPELTGTEPCAPVAEPLGKLSVHQLLNLSLCNNPTTRLSWISALSQAYSLGNTYTAYVPDVGVTASTSRSASNPARSSTTYTTSESIGISTSYTLYDFGRRERAVEQAMRSMVQANYAHDTALQSVILSTLQAYFSYINAQASSLAAQDAYALAQATYKAAQIRYDIGLVPKGDTLQAETAWLQAKIALEDAGRSLEIARGNVNERIGRAPNASLELTQDATLLNEDKLSGTVEAMMETAKQKRPDLINARLNVDNARTSLANERLQDLPTISVNAGRSYSQFDTQDRSTSGSIGINVSMPLFSGFKRVYSLQQAKLGVDASLESLKQAEQSAMLEVWQVYHDFQGARDRLSTANAALTSTEQAYRSSIARYREGLGSILDTLSTQSALVGARNQVLSTQLSFYTSGLSLMRAIGVLDARAALPKQMAAR